MTERRAASAGARSVLAEPQGVLVLPAEAAERVGYDVVVADSVQPPGARGCGWPTAPGRCSPAPDGSCASAPGAVRRCKQDLSTPWDLAWWHRPGRRRDGGDAPAVGAPPGHRPGRQHRRRAGGHVGRGHPRRGGGRGVVRPAVRPRGVRGRARGCGSPTPRRRRCARSTSPTRASSCGPTSARGCSTSATATVPADRGTAPAPARGDRPARRVGRGERHLQRRGPPFRPGRRRGEHARHRPGRAVRRPGRAATARVGRRLVVVESAAHQLVRVPLPDKARASTGWRTAPSDHAPRWPPGAVRLAVAFTPPTGQKLDRR